MQPLWLPVTDLLENNNVRNFQRLGSKTDLLWTGSRVDGIGPTLLKLSFGNLQNLDVQELFQDINRPDDNFLT